MNVVGSDMQVNLTVAKVSRPRRRPLAGRAAASRRRIVEVEFGDLPLDLVACPDRWDQDPFCAFVRSEVPQADGQVARAPDRVDLTPADDHADGTGGERSHCIAAEQSMTAYDRRRREAPG
jgi:hypothetical protein